MKKIIDLNSCTTGERVSFKAVVVDMKEMPKTTGGTYLNLSLSDSTGRLDTPIWDNIDMYMDMVSSGAAYKVSGNINKWNGNVQIKNIVLERLNVGEFDPCDFLSSYTIDKSLVEEFENTIRNLKEPYRSVAMAATGAIGYSHKRFKEFLACPSAEKHHGNRIGGLFLHTCGILKTLQEIYNIYDTSLSVYGPINKVIDYDRLVLKAILHDVMKLNEYEYETVIRRKPGKALNHLIEGVSYLAEINRELGSVLSEEDLDNISYAILSHHGQYGPYEPKTLEDTLLHLADMVDSRIVGAIEKA